jgi:RNA 2',3'-cyclic 3'-phosphodiesterase
VAEAPFRLFIAVPVPAETREACHALIEPVRTLPFGRYARWVRLDTLHVTLRFLGDTAPDRVPGVVDAVREGVGRRQAFGVRLGGAGSFPPEGRKIRALWLGIVDGAPELASIADHLGPPLARLGWPAEARPFRPHLTVARTDATGIRDAALTAQALEAAAEDWTTAFTVDRVVLFRSHLGGGPPRHEPLDEIPLMAEG